jgi:DNA-binding NtrC family response regulator
MEHYKVEEEGMNMMEKALVVDGDFLMSGYAVESLRREGLLVLEAATAAEASRLQAEHDFDIIFADLDLVSSHGRSFMCSSDTLLVVTTSFRMVEKAIVHVKNGAYDYLVKPFSEEQVSVVVTRARELFKLKERIGHLEKEHTGSTAMKPASESFSGFQIADYEDQINNLQELERRTILRVFRETGGSRNRMAEILGISVRTLRNKLVSYKQDTMLQV